MNNNQNENIPAPAEAAHLPAETENLPAEAAHLPAETAHCPVEAAHLPAETAHLPGDVSDAAYRRDIKYMKAALKQAEKAIAIGEVPIGAVIVYEDKIIARGYNRRNTDKTTLAHAEIACIKKACKKIGDWRLEGCTLYCTLEPCQMCAGAIIQSRIDRVVIGTTSPKSGCGGTLLNILQNPDFNHQADVLYGVMREECTEILQRFFKDLRRRNKERKKMLRMAEGHSQE
ncbi:MAG: tRNA adenosine(34) deaminase TadA [Lachnospiraceae bacterium]|nr:tRNA adenosine(34) deaminase TadA [Lachnospiraceae bacterium]